MKFLLNRIAVVLLVASLASVVVFAKGKKDKVKFLTDIKVNDTLVSKGEYEVKFDEQTGELSIVKDNKVIAKATASVEKREGKARNFTFRSSGRGDQTQLLGVTFAGADQEFVINGTQASR